MTEKEFAERAAAAGGRSYVVGGWTRDYLRGHTPQDKDYMLCGLSQEQVMTCYPMAKLIGRSFPVFLMPIGGEGKREDEIWCEVALARKERKIGTGYHGFQAEATAQITLEDDLYRRDLTINAMAMDILTEEIIDPYGGRADIEAGLLRPVSNHFVEDPVRALRAARFAAQLGYQLTDEVKLYMKLCERELLQEPSERLLGELKKALTCPQPSLFFRALEAANLLAGTFPELHALIGKTQPVEFHPEGDAFEHTMHILDEVSEKTDNIVARFAALCHDLGKGVTPRSMLPHHYGHEVKGLDVFAAWNQRMTFPVKWSQAAKFIIEQHMRAPRLGKAAKITELLLKLHKVESDLPLEDVKHIICADHNGLPVYLDKAEELIPKLLAVKGTDAPPALTGKKIGEWVRKTQVEICQRWLNVQEKKIGKQ